MAEVMEQVLTDKVLKESLRQAGLTACPRIFILGDRHRKRWISIKR